MADPTDPGTLIAGGLGSLLGSGLSFASTQSGIGAVGDERPRCLSFALRAETPKTCIRIY